MGSFYSTKASAAAPANNRSKHTSPTQRRHGIQKRRQPGWSARVAAWIETTAMTVVIAAETAAAFGGRVTRSQSRSQVTPTFFCLASPPKKAAPAPSRANRMPAAASTNATPTTSTTSTTNTSSPKDSPFQLPHEVRHIVPQFDICGKQHCGQHPATPAELSSSSAPAPKWVVCRDCKKNETAAAMHRLPCGHALCRPCLNDAVCTIEARILSAPSWAVIEQHLYDHFFEGTYGHQATTSSTGWSVRCFPNSSSLSTSSLTTTTQHPSHPPPQPASRTTAAQAGKVKKTAFDLALAAAAFTCCGRPMQLDTHMACMDADAAAAYWLAHESLRWPPDLTRHRCGWPDCGRLLAPDCSYERRGVTRFYCARCRGSSLFVREGYTVPAR